MTEKLFHIYAKDKCIYHNLPENEFNQIWNMLNNFVSIIGELKTEDLSYEEVTVNKEVLLNSSH